MAERRPEIFIPGMVRLKSGLIVPAEIAGLGRQSIDSPLALPQTPIPDKALLVVGQPPSDLDTYFAAPDPEALGVMNPSLEAICETLRIVPVEPAMFGLAGIAASAWHASRDQAKHLKLAEEIFVGRPVLDVLREFLNEDPHHVLFNEQHLTILTRLLLIHGAQADAKVDMTDEQVDALLTAMLGVGGLTARHADPERSGDEPMAGCRGWCDRVVTSIAPISVAIRAAPAVVQWVPPERAAGPAVQRFLSISGSNRRSVHSGVMIRRRLHSGCRRSSERVGELEGGQ